MLKKYLESSTIHGLVYLSRRNHITEKIFWIIFQVISITCTSILIVQLIQKIHNFPVVIQLSDVVVPVGQINFPAVTFCSGIFMQNDRSAYEFPKYEVHTMKKSQKTFEEFYGITMKDAELPIKMYKIPRQFEKSGIDLRNISEFSLKRIHAIDLVTKSGIFQRLNLSVPTDDILKIFNTFHKRADQSEIDLYWLQFYSIYASEIMTESGLCLTFNMANLTDVLRTNIVSRDFHYQHNLLFRANTLIPKFKRPLKSSTSVEGISGYFQIGNYDFPDFCSYCAGLLKTSLSHEGIYLLIHSPYELPSIASVKYPASNNHKNKFLINPELMKIDDLLKSLEPDGRNCYLDNEKQLKFFKVYTKINCEMECLSEYMVSSCGCVEFYMIRNLTARVCSANEKNCYDTARSDFENKIKGSCRCFELCDYVKYRVEAESHPNYESVLQSNTIVEAKFTENLYSQYIRKKQFNEVDFLSFVGGLLGLFAGFSALSFVELIYWLIIKPIACILTRRSTRVFPFESMNDISYTKCSFFIDFVRNSSVHGVNYFMESNFIPKLFWILSFFLSIGFCGWLISGVNEKVPNSRTMSYDANVKAISNIPFPALTFAPEVNTDEDHEKYVPSATAGIFTYREFLEYLKNVQQSKIEEMERYFVSLSFCSGNYAPILNYPVAHLITKYIDRNSTWFVNPYSVFNQQFAPKFAKIRTARGIGYTFNLLDANQLLNSNEIDPELLYNSNISFSDNENLLELSPYYAHPITVMSTDRPEFILKFSKPDVEKVYTCRPPGYLLHHSDELPTFSSYSSYATLKYGMKLDMEVIPILIKTDKSLLNLDVMQRECYKNGEQKLRFFKKYTQRNCEIECLTNYTLWWCNCTSLVQPYNPSKGINYCRDQKLEKSRKCVNNAQRWLMTSKYFSYEKNCSCLPTCDSYSYKIKYNREFIGGNETIISVRTNMDDMVLYRRYQQFTFSDVVSYVGGLLGLFAGISMMSFVEFVYFFTIRLGTNFWRSRN